MGFEKSRIGFARVEAMSLFLGVWSAGISIILSISMKRKPPIIQIASAPHASCTPLRPPSKHQILSLFPYQNREDSLIARVSRLLLAFNSTLVIIYVSATNPCSLSAEGSTDLLLTLTHADSDLNERVRDGLVVSELHDVGCHGNAQLLGHLLHLFDVGLGRESLSDSLETLLGIHETLQLAGWVVTQIL